MHILSQCAEMPLSLLVKAEVKDLIRITNNANQGVAIAIGVEHLLLLSLYNIATGVADLLSLSQDYPRSRGC